MSNIEVVETAWAEIAPTAAYIHVVLTSDRFFSGRAALEKAEELRRLCGALASADIPESRVALEGASLDVSSGLFTKSSSVTYRLRIHLVDLELLAPALDVIANAKKATLSHVEWDYTNAPANDAILAQAAKRASSKARTLAEALGVTLGRIETAREERLEDEVPVSLGAPKGAVKMRAARSSVANELAGLDLAPKKNVGVRVRVVFAMNPES
jgi:uncharacterized protein YggE